ncbi:tetratricopeptide repeat-containing glycosyltransferase family protein [Azospirillum sp.]|uniref:tetratricopeptide repeat-containing glycosyltransferase family protein n=1 Tax=Azospirillum sp. TaxID=34012 RepID=UPI002D473255|nr:tetratricopeptide repeat-containing glycosyltransferase family protein [Azospirillum sp.]HYD70469.1 tetratricopeptide repeat-containing glycosyltransferase family protein [Azospirillum sp.]
MLLGIGLGHYEHQEPARAAEAFRAAIRLAPGLTAAHSNLGVVLRHLGRFEESLAAYAQALALRPDAADVLYNSGFALVGLGRLAEAEAVYRRVTELDPAGAGAHHQLGQLLLLRGAMAEGAAEFEWRANNVFFRDRPETRHHVPVWDGRPLPDSTLWLQAEGGIGDAIQFIRYVPRLLDRVGRVALSYRPDLAHLFRTLAGGDRVLHNPTSITRVGGCAMFLSLPHLAGTTLDTVPADTPYLKADPGLVDHWRRVLADVPGLKVGLAWESRGDRVRSVAVAELLAALGSIPGVSLISLQKGLGAEELAALPEEQRARIRCYALDEGGEVFADTAAIMTVVDLVITIDTAVAHLAGALGVATWVLLAHLPEWRWLMDREDSPWYPTLRLFRQRTAGDWAPPLAEAAGLLRWMAAVASVRSNPSQ